MTDSNNTDSELVAYRAKRKAIFMTVNLAMTNAVQSFETSRELANTDEVIEVAQYTLEAAFRSALRACTDACKALDTPPKDQFEQNSTKISLICVVPQ